jgi:hypothetical protein
MIIVVPFGFLYQQFVCTYIVCRVRATYPLHFIVFHLIILIILCEEYKLWNSSLCIFLQHRVISLILGPNIPLYSLFWNANSLCSSRTVRDESEKDRSRLNCFLLYEIYSSLPQVLYRESISRWWPGWKFLPGRCWGWELLTPWVHRL